VSEEGSIRLRSPAAPKGGVKEKGRVTPLRMTSLRKDSVWAIRHPAWFAELL